ncbi:uncharacterized protein [Haliotis cracherodii]|uniref:uncharacterized protein n=1 Tax=Haliotis cracherodii TaxID=6455 RepID=UPI0039E9FF4E
MTNSFTFILIAFVLESRGQNHSTSVSPETRGSKCLLGLRDGEECQTGNAIIILVIICLLLSVVFCIIPCCCWRRCQRRRFCPCRSNEAAQPGSRITEEFVALRLTEQ